MLIQKRHTASHTLIIDRFEVSLIAVIRILDDLDSFEIVVSEQLHDGSGVGRTNARQVSHVIIVHGQYKIPRVKVIGLDLSGLVIHVDFLLLHQLTPSLVRLPAYVPIGSGGAVRLPTRVKSFLAN